MLVGWRGRWECSGFRRNAMMAPRKDAAHATGTSVDMRAAERRASRRLCPLAGTTPVSRGRRSCIARGAAAVTCVRRCQGVQSVKVKAQRAARVRACKRVGKGAVFISAGGGGGGRRCLRRACLCGLLPRAQHRRGAQRCVRRYGKKCRYQAGKEAARNT